MRHLIFIFLLAFAVFSQTPSIEPGVSQELARWRAAHYSDVRYKISLTLEKMSPVLKGTMEVRVKLKGASVGPIILDWRKLKGFENRSSVSNVSINGRVRSPAFRRPSADAPSSLANEGPPKGGTPYEGGIANGFEESNEHLIFRDGVVVGENIIKLDFTSPILPSGSAITRYNDKEDGSEYIYSLFVPSDASTAFPVFDQPDLKAKFTLSISAPKSWQSIVSNAELDHMIISDGICGLPVQPLNVSALLSSGKATPTPTPTATPVKPEPCEMLDIWSFKETKPISTYVFAFAVGPWERVASEEASLLSVPPAVAGGSEAATKNPPATAGGTDKSDQQTLIYVRRSQLAKFKPHAAEVFRLNREAVRYFEEYFDYKFPFPKYDLVLIPEFPFGGMEHAGATFLREAGVIFPQEPTKNDHATRATLIFHEAAHQWFGDTVTMKWFDDLWLKEGFATFTAYKAMEKIMPEMNSWKVFYERIKQGAYQTDSTKGTTAIYQPIPNLSAAKSAYGNIVYNKAPAFLRQAEFYLGEDKFRAAVRSFLKKHEFRNATWEDLVNEFEVASGRDLKEWANVWVKRRGLPFARAYESHGGNAVTQYAVKQYGLLDENNGLEWEMKTKVLVILEERTIKDGRRVSAVRSSISDAVLEKTTSREIPKPIFQALVGRTVPLIIFPNYQDYGYGIFLLDDKSRDYVLKNIQNQTDPFLRSMMWGALWDSVREGELDPKQYVELAIGVVGKSSAFTRDQRSESSAKFTPEGVTLTDDESTTAMILNRVSTAMTYYLSDVQRDEVALRLESMLVEKMRTAPTLGQRITYYRAFLNVASTDKARSTLKDILDLKFQISDLKLKTKDRFDIVTKLASLNDPDAEKLLAELEKTETSDDAKRYAYAARAAFPTKETKEKYWNDFVDNKQISESWIEAAFGPFNSVRHADLTLPYLERALKELPNHKRNRKIFFVNGWLAAFIGGQRSEEALAIVNKFLADNPNLDRDLRLKILENVDLIERAVKIRGSSRQGDPGTRGRDVRK